MIFTPKYINNKTCTTINSSDMRKNHHLLTKRKKSLFAKPYVCEITQLELNGMHLFNNVTLLIKPRKT